MRHTAFPIKVFTCSRTSGKKNLKVQLHLHETSQEIQESLDETGLRPLARIESLGILNGRLQAIHLTQLNLDEIDRLAKNKVHVGHCPESNMKLGSGVCPIGDLLAKKINVAIGTDSPASNNDLDMLQEVRTASFYPKQSLTMQPKYPQMTVSR